MNNLNNFEVLLQSYKFLINLFNEVNKMQKMSRNSERMFETLEAIQLHDGLEIALLVARDLFNYSSDADEQCAGVSYLFDRKYKAELDDDEVERLR